MKNSKYSELPVDLLIVAICTLLITVVIMAPKYLSLFN